MKLLFVYNASSGMMDKWLDTAHKIINPATYHCALCALTHGNFKEKSTWKDFRETAGIDMVFLYKDAFLKQYKSKWLPNYEFPLVLLDTGNSLEVFISSEEFNGFEDVANLIATIQQRLVVD